MTRKRTSDQNGITWFHLLVCAPLLASTLSVHAAEISYFRLDRGIGADTAFPTDLSDPNNLIWKQPLDSGHSTPCIIGDHIYLTSYNADKQELATIALDRATGKQVWKRIAPTKDIESVHRTGNPAAATPASDGERVYVFFGSYGLLCYSLDGKPVWSRPLGPFQDEFGAASSPILAGERLLLNQDHDTNNFLYAFNKHTGEIEWQVSRDDFTRSYSTPIVWQNGDRTEVIVAGALQLNSYDVDDGSKLWWVDGLARIVNPTPVIADEKLFVPTWSPGGDVGERIGMEPFAAALAQYDKDADGRIAREELPPGAVLTRFYRIDLDQDDTLDQTEWEKHARVFERAENSILAIRLGGRGDLTDRAVAWQHHRGIPYVASPTVHHGVVYLVKDSGILTTLDAETGRVLKSGRLKGRGNYYSSPYVAGEAVYLGSERGVMTVISAKREWQVISSHDYGEAIYATPVVSDGKLYIRTSGGLYCYGRSK